MAVVTTAVCGVALYVYVDGATANTDAVPEAKTETVLETKTDAGDGVTANAPEDHTDAVPGDKTKTVLETKTEAGGGVTANAPEDNTNELDPFKGLTTARKLRDEQFSKMYAASIAEGTANAAAEADAFKESAKLEAAFNALDERSAKHLENWNEEQERAKEVALDTLNYNRWVVVSRIASVLLGILAVLIGILYFIYSRRLIYTDPSHDTLVSLHSYRGRL
jgi:hypothetical protein